MGSSEVSTRLKREDCERTKHDSAFSDWKILIGPSDWEDHLVNKEGAEKYRTQNLPNCSSCPGLYELGIAKSHAQSGREVGKLNKSHIIPVYLGQADNVRTRLQRYGREGAHLEKSFSNGELNDCKGHRLFTEIFSRGLPIVYRWAPMKNKRDAEKKEGQLLDTFDYAWNKGSNGARRPNDIHQKLDSSTSSATQFPHIFRQFEIFRQRKVGLKIKPCEPLLLENGSSFYANQERNDIYSRVFTFSRSRPRLASMRFGVDEDHISICGVALGKGSVCIRSPVEGRKRCAEHKGVKVNGSTPKLITEEKEHHVWGPILDNSTICGVDLEDGTFCTRQPIVGRVRCEEHKGMRVTTQKSKLIAADIPSVFADSGVSISRDRKYNYTSTQSVSPRTVVNYGSSSTCGATTLDGSFCSRKTSEGRKCCWQHEGKIAKIPSVFADSGVSISNDRKYNNTSTQLVSPKTVVIYGSSSTCGATTQDGSFCRRTTGEGKKWCWQHEAKIANIPSVFADSGVSISNDRKYNNTSTQLVSPKTVVIYGSSSTCGATTQDGSFCRRKTGEGRKWCWQHEAKSADIPSVFVGSCRNAFNNYSFSTCGAPTRNGSFCRRKPGQGSSRCWQHGG